jgi:hypothetical protein
MSSKVANSVLAGAAVLYALRKYNPEILYDQNQQLRFGDKTLEIVAAAAAVLMYMYGPNVLDMVTGNKYTASAGIFGPDMLGANMAQTFRGQAGVAGNTAAVDLGATFTE